MNVREPLAEIGPMETILLGLSSVLLSSALRVAWKLLKHRAGA